MSYYYFRFIPSSEAAIAISGCQPTSHNVDTSSSKSAIAESVGIAVEISLLTPRAQPRSKSWGSSNIFFVRGRAKSGRGRRFQLVRRTFFPPYTIIILIYCRNQHKMHWFYKRYKSYRQCSRYVLKVDNYFHRKAGSTWWFVQWRHRHHFCQFCLQVANLVKRCWFICKCRYTNTCGH